jgi:hypothetical protein
MRFSRALVALSVVLPAVAQNTNYTSGFIAALNSAGLTTLASVLGSVNASLINALQQGNHTVFAPSNDALASADLASIGNITNIFEYHIAAGLVNATSLNTTDTVIRTTLGAPTVVLRKSSSFYVTRSLPKMTPLIAYSRKSDPSPYLGQTFERHYSHPKREYDCYCGAKCHVPEFGHLGKREIGQG